LGQYLMTTPSSLLKLSPLMLESPHREPYAIERDIFNFGRMCERASIFSDESCENKVSAKADRRKKWAEERAAELKENGPNATKEELWRMIPKDSGEEDENGEGGVKRYDGFEVWRGWKKDAGKNKTGREVVVANCNNKGQDFLIKSSFLRYLPNTRKK
jgi:hypothetical protein